LATHLFALVELNIPLHQEQAGIYRQDFYKLICKSFMRAKQQRYGSHQPFTGDLSLALDLARDELPTNFVQMVRECLIQATLGSFATNVSLEALTVLVQAGQADKARGFAALIHDPNKRYSAFEMIGRMLLT